MSEFDQFSFTLFEQAKRFLEKSKSEDTAERKIPYLNAALVIGVSSLEAHVNAIADEMLMRNGLTILDRSILSEAAFYLKDGEFVLNERKLKMYRLLDRIEFIHLRFSGKPLDKNSKWWSKLKLAQNKRNSLVHPKEKFVLTEKIVESSLEGILGALNALYSTLYKKSYPALGRRLDSNLNF
jgi:hypothetical protein